MSSMQRRDICTSTKSSERPCNICTYGSCSSGVEQCLIKMSRVNKNKDHQRMMVDPMFMIVWSFLTAVTTTAVTPIAVILPLLT